ncbi:MAG TPA: hypothetical protein VHV57_08130 [Acidimicrobiales bacterium]|jgi:hypothetical protein|nr:hypothetical protein [Acidimicrobiales bacterium]
MFGKRKLLENGAQAEAIVTWSGNPGAPPGSAPFQYQVALSVQFPDGSTADIRRRVFGQFIDTGDVVPVRFDPADRSKIEIDYAARLASEQSRIDGGKQRALSTAEAERSRANVVRDIESRTTTPTDAELQAVFDREQEARELSRASIRRYGGSTPSDEQLRETSRLTEAILDARAELAALRVLRPDWSPQAS